MNEPKRRSNFSVSVLQREIYDQSECRNPAALPDLRRTSGCELMVGIKFDEESDYGQDVLELIGEVNLLMDMSKIYTKTEINAILIHVKVQAERIQHNMSGRDKMPYFGFFKDVEE